MLVSHRPLVFVSGLTVGDYLLWNWSLSSSHEVVALVAGLTLPPLAVATLWLMALSLTRLLARFARGTGGRRRRRQHLPSARVSPGTGTMAADESAAAATGGASSRKLAA